MSGAIKEKAISDLVDQVVRVCETKTELAEILRGTERLRQNLCNVLQEIADGTAPRCQSPDGTRPGPYMGEDSPEIAIKKINILANRALYQKP